MNTSSNHILSAYNNELAALAALRRDIAATALRNLDEARRGVLERNLESCLSAIADDGQVNHLESEIEKQAMAILARFQPVAGDLREVIASMRLATNLERASDEAKTIGKRGRSLAARECRPDLSALVPLFEQAISELTDACMAYEARDLELAASIKQRDKTLDRAHRAALRSYAESLPTAEGIDPTTWLDLLLIIRALERIGDHAKNIAEETTFLTGASLS